MRLSIDWLKSFGVDIPAETLAQRLTMAGLEVDGIESVAPVFSQIVVGEVKTLEAHPDADKLRVATVDVGQGALLQIVCGAPNVAVGIKVPTALVGAVLPGNIKIKQSKLRGVASHGMLCSARELGISEDHSGLLILPADAPVGRDIRTYLALEDAVLDIDLTPNRADAFSMRGLAREIGVLFDIDVELAVPTPVAAQQAATIQVVNDAPKACARYFAREIHGVDITRPTPLWLAERLRRAGIRTHDAIVDVTNYVMMTLGTPMHAFDAETVHGSELHVRFAHQNEVLTLLNGQNAALEDDVLVIADKNRPLAIAGVMGGIDSACTAQTQHIVLESAWFDPVCIAGKSRRYGLASDSAQRFERGVDFTLQEAAIALATQLITEICGGCVHEIVADEHPELLPSRQRIILRRIAIRKRIGREYADAQVVRILQRLGCTVVQQPDGWSVMPPSWRFDYRIEEDLIEEVVRVDGYEHVEAVTPVVSYRHNECSSQRKQLYQHCQKLVESGFSEAITYSFINRESQQIFFPDAPVITLQNPISTQLAEMRLSLLPGLVNAVAYNRNRQQNDVRLFEVGKVFQPQGDRAVDCLQIQRIGGVLCGRSDPEQWAIAPRMLDFYDVKGIVEQLLGGRGHYQPTTQQYLHPGQGADILIDGQYVGCIGALHPLIQQKMAVKGGTVWLFELSDNALIVEPTPQYCSIAKYPSVRRDLAVVLDKSVPADEVRAVIQQEVGELLADTFFFDQYEGTHLGVDKKSLAIAIILQSADKTLQDEEVERIIAALFEKLKQLFNAELR